MEMLWRVDPFGELDRSFDDGWTRGRTWPVALDAYRRGERLVIHFDLPGVDPESIELTVDKDLLTLRATRKWAEEAGDELVARERPQGTFERQVSLGDNLDTERLEARYDRGVLTVMVPVREQARARKVPVAILPNATSGPAPPSR